MSRKLKCVHLADVHFRGLTRHNQYRKSFSNFFEQMQDVKPDIIFVGGDIVHSKTQGISPELIDILSWWFRGLSTAATHVHITLGNHDGLLLNKERQDAITPILEALNLPNVHLHKKSGAYKTHISGFNFCVFSCFDEENWENVKPISGDINIACFHGSVVGSLTDIDWELEGEVEASFFDAFDFAMLGDIHKAQFMDKDNRIAYCGSTIQQNFGESTKKGYLLWDIDNKENFDVSFHAVENDSPFITIAWRGTTQETLDHADIPTGARVRVQSKRPIQQTSWTHLKNFMKENYDISELVYDLRREKTSVTNHDNTSSTKNENFRDFGTLSKYMSSWLKAAECDESDYELAIGYLKKIHDQIPAPDCLRNVRWSIDSIEFDNVYSYGKGNKIDFNTLRGVVGIFGKNRTGKSSIPGTIMYGLFNSSDRGAIKNIHIVNVRKDHCNAVVKFTVNGTKYMVERQTVKKSIKSGKQHAVTHVNCFELDTNGDPIKDMTEEQRRETEKTIRSLLGTAETFLLTSFASQGAMDNFLKERATSRKSILTSFLDFTIFEELNKIARQDMVGLKSKLSEVSRRDFSSIEQEKISELSSYKLKLQKNEKLKKVILEDLHAVQLQLSRLPSEIVTQSDVDQQQTKINELLQKIKDLTEEKLQFLKDWRIKKEKVSELRNIMASSGVEDLRAKILHADKVWSKIVDLQRDLRLVEKKAATLDDPGFLKGCKCLNEAEEALTQTSGMKEKISILIKEHDDINVVELQNKISKIDAICNKAETIEREVKSSTGKSDIFDERIKVTEERSSLEQAHIQKMLKHVSNDPENNRLDELKVRKKELERASRDYDGKQISLAKSVGQLQGEIKHLQEERKRFNQLTSEWKVIELVSEATSKKGIPLNVLGRKLPEVNAEIAQILQGYTGFTVEIEADQESNAMDIYINYGDSRRIIECASGMEKMMASLAIRVALMNLTTLPRCDLLMIDEGFGALDEINVEACSGLLHSLKKWFKSILVISHVDAVKDSVDNVIEISKKGQDSYVNTCE